MSKVHEFVGLRTRQPEPRRRFDKRGIAKYRGCSVREIDRELENEEKLRRGDPDAKAGPLRFPWPFERGRPAVLAQRDDRLLITTRSKLTDASTRPRGAGTSPLTATARTSPRRATNERLAGSPE